MRSNRNVIGLVYLTICCAGGFNQVETRPKMSKVKSKEKSYSKSKGKSGNINIEHKKVNEKIEKQKVEITNLEKYKN